IDDVQDALNAGADKVSMNTAAVLRPDLVREASERFGAQCVVVAIDAKRVGEGQGHGRGQGGGMDQRLGQGASANPDRDPVPGPLPAPAHAPAPRWEVFTHGGSKATGLDAV